MGFSLMALLGGASAAQHLNKAVYIPKEKLAHRKSDNEQGEVFHHRNETKGF